MQNPPPYAPVATRAAPLYVRIRRSAIDLNKEVTLYDTNSARREVFESLLEIYSIVVVLDLVEKSYLKDGLITKARNPDTSEETVIDNYTPTVLRLLNQYNSLLKVDETKREFQSLAAFKENYKVNCPLATRRIEVGVPATMENLVLQSPSSNSEALVANKMKSKAEENKSAKAGGISSRAVAEATGSFITLMDALKLDYKAKDQLYPLLSDLITSINKVLGDDEESDSGSDDGSESESDGDNDSVNGNNKSSSADAKGKPGKLDFEGRNKLVAWLVKLNNMKVDEELGADDVRQFLFDLETAYKNFYTCLE